MVNRKNATSGLSRAQFQSQTSAQDPSYSSYSAFEASLDTAIAAYSEAMQKQVYGRKRAQRMHTIGSQLKQRFQKLPDGRFGFSLANLVEGVQDSSGLQDLTERNVSDDVRRLINGLWYKENIGQGVVKRKFYVTYVNIDGKQYGVLQFTNSVA